MKRTTASTLDDLRCAVAGQPEHHPEGDYWLRKGQEWIKAGKTPQDEIDATFRLAENKQPEPDQPKMWQSAMAGKPSIGKAPWMQAAMELVLKNFDLGTGCSSFFDRFAPPPRNRPGGLG